MNFDRFSIKHNHTHSTINQPVERYEAVNKKVIDEEVYQNLRRDLENLEYIFVKNDGSIQINENTYTKHRLTFVKCDDETFELDISVQYGICHNSVKALDKDGNHIPMHDHGVDIPINIGKVIRMKIVSTQDILWKQSIN